MHHFTEMRTIIEIVSGIVLFIAGMVLSPVAIEYITRPKPTPPPEPEPPAPKKFTVAIRTPTGIRKVTAQTLSYSRQGHLELLIEGKICAIFPAGKWESLEVVAEEAKAPEKKADEPTTESSL